MRHDEKVQVDGKTESRFVKRTCDFCGIGTDHYQNWPDDGSGVTVPRIVSDTSISHQTGLVEDEGGSGETLRLDICPRCFHEKLIPWAKAQGAQPRTDEWAWTNEDLDSQGYM